MIPLLNRYRIPLAWALLFVSLTLIVIASTSTVAKLALELGAFLAAGWSSVFIIQKRTLLRWIFLIVSMFALFVVLIMLSP